MSSIFPYRSLVDDVRQRVERREEWPLQVLEARPVGVADAVRVPDRQVADRVADDRQVAARKRRDLGLGNGRSDRLRHGWAACPRRRDRGQPSASATRAKATREALNRTGGMPSSVRRVGRATPRSASIGPQNGRSISP